MKTANPSDCQYYEGIKQRAQPLVISIQTTANTNTTTTQQQQQQQVSLKNVRRNKPQTIMPMPQQTSTTSTALTVIADSSEIPPASPASPILKAQLSAPPKQREGVVTAAGSGGGASKADVKSQVSGWKFEKKTSFVL